MYAPKFNTQDTGFVLSHIVGAFECQSGSKRKVGSFRRNQNGTNSVTIHINNPIRHQNPFGFRVRPLLRDWFLTIFRFENLDVLIRELKLPWLIILNGLQSEVIEQYTPLDCLLRGVLYITNQSELFSISQPVRSMLAFHWFT